MAHPHDDLTFAQLQGFYEYLVNGPDTGRTHETSADWNEAYDKGRDEAEAFMARQGHVDQLIEAGDALNKAFGVIMPGVAHIALQDYSVLNAGMVWAKARQAALAAPAKED